MRLNKMYMRLLGWVFLVTLGVGACQPAWHDASFDGVRGKSTSATDWQGNAYTVLFFLGPECPLCENYALNFNELYDEFHSDSIRFYGVFSGTSYSEEEIVGYKNAFGVKMPFYFDPDFALANGVDATVTPEVVVLDKNLKTVYRGAIDNWAVTVRKHRQVVTEYYLKDVLTALENGQEPPFKITEPVGCFIE